MTPRELTSGAVRNLPGTPAAERKEHGPITNLVRKDRCGCVAYEGTCDGEPVCIVELSAGMWRARTRDAVLAEGPLVEVLRVKVGDEWIGAGEHWGLATAGHNSFVHFCRIDGPPGHILYEARAYLSDFLAAGWRPWRSR